MPISTSKKIDKTDIPGFIVEWTAKRMKQQFQRTLKNVEAGITADQWVILHLLYQKNGLSQLEIGQQTFKDAPTVTRIIDLLCDKALTERIPDKTDRRKFSIQLTKVGKAKVKSLLPLVKKYRAQTWEGLTEKDLSTMIRILNTISSNLEQI